MKLKKVLCSVLAVMLSILILGTAAYAEPYIPEEMQIINAPDIGSQNFSLDGVEDESDISKLKSSNKKVATASTFTYGGMVYIAVSPKKAGNATITFNYKDGGKTKKGKVKVTVYDYEDPFKSVKIGSKSYSFKKQRMITVDKALKGKLTIKLKKGWTLQGVSSYNYKNGEDFQSLSANKKITVKKGYRLDIQVSGEDGSWREFYIEVR